MKIGIAGPLSIRPLAPFLEAPPEALPEGLVGTSVLLLVQGLLAAGHRVSVYTLDMQVTSPVTFSGKQLTVFVGPYRVRHRMRDFMRQERTAVRHFIEHDVPDIVHAHWTYEYALGALGSRRPTLITVRDWAPAILRLSPDLYRVGRLLMNAATLFKGQHFVANSPYIQKRFERYLRRIVPVIPNAMADHLFARPKEKAAEAPTIVSISNGFLTRKGGQVLFHAFQHIRNRMPGCQLRLIGTGFEPGGIAEQWATTRKMTDGVTFLGPLPHASVLGELETADILIHPSLEESFGMTLLEAMAKGVPVVAGVASGAVPWVLGNGSAGVLTDVTAPNAIACATLRLLTDPVRWKHFSSAGYAHAWKNFRLSRIVDQHLAEYEKVLSSPPTSLSNTRSIVHPNELRLQETGL